MSFLSYITQYHLPRSGTAQEWPTSHQLATKKMHHRSTCRPIWQKWFPFPRYAQVCVLLINTNQHNGAFYPTLTDWHRWKWWSSILLYPEGNKEWWMEAVGMCLQGFRLLERFPKGSEQFLWQRKQITESGKHGFKYLFGHMLILTT